MDKLNKNKYKVLAGAAVILFGLTAALVFSIRDQPDPGKKPKTTTQQKEESHESTDEIRRDSTEEVRYEDGIEVHGTGHLYYLDPEGDQTFERRLTRFVSDEGIKAGSAEVMDYCIDNRKKEKELAQFFLVLDDRQATIVRVCFEKTTGTYRFNLYDGSLPDVDEEAERHQSTEMENEIPENIEEEEVPKSRLTITDPEGELKAAGTFCERYFGDDYDYVYAVHTDQAHIHAHIVFNSVNRRTGYKYRYEKGDWEKFIQSVTDEVCRELGLPLLSDQRTGERAMHYAEHKAMREGMPTLTRIVRADIDRMILRSDSLDDFFVNMRRLGYRIRKGKYITYCPPGFVKGRRDKNLGGGYLQEDICRRILHKDLEAEPSSVITASFFGKMEKDKCDYCGQRYGYDYLIYEKVSS